MAEEREENRRDDLGNIINAIQIAKEGAPLLSSGPWVLIAVGVLVFIVIMTSIITTGGQAAGSEEDQSQVAQQTQPVQSNSLTYWANNISLNIKQFDESCNGLTLWNVLTSTITNGSYTSHNRTGSACGLAATTYFCTDFVVDTYNLSGITMPNLEYAGDMLNWWKNQPNLNVREQNDITGLAPGDVVFWVDPNQSAYYLRWKHVGIIEKIGINDKGQLTLTTMDANINHKVNEFPIINNQVRGTFVDDSGNSIGWQPEFGLGPRK